MKQLPRQLADPLGQYAAVKRENLGGVRDGVLRQPGLLGRDQHVSWSVGSGEIARERHTDDRRDPTPVQRVPLHHDDGPPVARA